MKYELETIPVWRAYESGAACPLCMLQDEAEKQYVKFFLGNSVMAPEMRVQVNETGFCRRHFHKLLAGEGKLGLSLVAQTHIDEVTKNVAGKLRAAAGGLRRKRLGAYVAEAREQLADCMVCRRMVYTLGNYTFTLVTLWADDEAFPAAYSASDGLCLAHTLDVAEMAARILPRERSAEFLSVTADVLEKSVSDLAADLESFVQGFDYRSSGHPTEAIKSAPSRAIEKLAGRG